MLLVAPCKEPSRCLFLLISEPLVPIPKPPPLVLFLRLPVVESHATVTYCFLVLCLPKYDLSRKLAQRKSLLVAPYHFRTRLSSQVTASAQSVRPFSSQMQLSAHPHRRTPAPAFIDHTPRDFEITAPANPSQSPDMFSGAADMGKAVLAAGPLYTNAVMGQAPSAEQREHVRKASSTILREDSIKVELHDDIHGSFGEQESRPDSLHYDRTDQRPYVKNADDKMMTQTSLLHLPKANASHDLAYFLKTTGPNAPSRRPRKVDDHPRRAMSASKNVLKWLGVGQRRPPASVTDAHNE